MSGPGSVSLTFERWHLPFRIILSAVTPLFFLVSVACFFPPVPASADDLFSRQGDAITRRAREVISEVRSSDSPGRAIGQQYLRQGPDYTSQHPWINGNPSWAMDWRADSTKIVERNAEEFFDCADPRVVEETCDYCQPHFNGMFVEDRCTIPFVNPGMVVEYWWPELEVEVNNFGISVIDPNANGRSEYARQELWKRIEAQFPSRAKSYLERYGATADPAIPAGLSRAPHAGNSHWDGLLSPDQTQVAEAHTFLTEVQDRSSKLRSKGAGYCGKLYVRIYSKCIEVGDFWFNGWMKGNSQKCFYDVLDPQDDVIKPWTEDMSFAPTWRLPVKSGEINNDFYKASVPFQLTDQVSRNFELIRTSTYAKNGSCDSFRVQTWPDLYGDLKQAIGIIGTSMQPLDTICYKGGDQLYPLTGALIKEHNGLVAGAFLSRRALELIGMVGDHHLDGEMSSSVRSSSDYWSKHDWQHINKFTRLPRRKYELAEGRTEVDKLQRVSPDPTRCFHMGEVGEHSDATRKLFPPGELRPKDNGSVRYVYWNKRKMCACEMRGGVSAVEKDAGTDSCTESWMQQSWNLDNKGWGCQLYPRNRLDEARGNLEEDTVKGEKNPRAKLPMACVFPFRGSSVCGMLDSMDRNSNTSGGSSGGGRSIADDHLNSGMRGRMQKSQDGGGHRF